MLIENNRIRWIIVLASILVSLWWLAPNFISISSQNWWLSKEKLVYGLDIQGGLHLVLGVNVEEVFQTKLLRAKNTIVETLNQEDIKVKEHHFKSNIEIQLENNDQAPQARKIIEKEFGTLFQFLRSDRGQFELNYSQVQSDRIKKEIIEQSIEVIRNRIDEFGVSEPLITAQGDKRVLVQLPGIKEAEKAKELIRKTARLELKLVSDKFSSEELSKMIAEAESKGKYSLESLGSYRKYVKRLNQDLKDLISDKISIAFMKDPSSQTLSAGRIPMLVEEDTGLSGDMLEDASVGAGQFGEPVVLFRFGVEGRKILSQVTAQNIGRPLAVVLDDVIKTAPQIQGQIFDQGQISLGAGDRTQLLEEAEMISTTLRAGALPARLEQLEERTVGPTLGRDYIQKGKTSAVIAIILVLIFLLAYYKWQGVIANIALILNMSFLLSFLTSFGATLTLPGVAGIILTMGMAVDANIIIFERIKEEFKRGSSLKLSVSEGFNRAFSAILDANITTAIVCLILMYFGTGPIKGFAVTLFCGIITSVFTAVFVSRTIMNFCVHQFQLKKI